MTFEAENTAIESRFSANFTATPIKWDNVAFAQPTDSPWVEINIIDGNAFPASLNGGSVLYRHTGIISVNIYVPVGTASKVARQYADQIAAIYRGQQFSSINCYEASIHRLGERDGWFVFNVTVPFYRDEAF
ncbi:MAG: hypothetical protein DRP09_15780 [Candidatus Thorarchaeota archaeon]|nr:MAG: hypothetical protein DRP09_15780 [Candidatus Thorarchaeota archaeon]